MAEPEAPEMVLMSSPISGLPVGDLVAAAQRIAKKSGRNDQNGVKNAHAFILGYLQGAGGLELDKRVKEIQAVAMDKGEIPKVLLDRMTAESV